jgi:hypothetical protein
VRLLALRHADSRHGFLSEGIALQKDDTLEGIRQRTGSRKAGNTGADDNGLLTNDCRQSGFLCVRVSVP